jgi:type I restriction enzyme R subunit
MSIPAHAEQYYHDSVERQFVTNGWRSVPSDAYDQSSGLVVSDLLAFLEATQPGHLPFDGDLRRFASDIRHAISKVGAAHAFKHGLTVNGKHMSLVGFKPQFSATQNSLYNDHQHNRFTVIRELEFNHLRQRLDMAVFLNGIPLFTFELKSELSAQTAADAMHQYCSDRDPATSVLLRPAVGALAHFAVSQDSAAFTTRLQGPGTVFLPFNPAFDYERPTEHAYKTDYLWRDVLSPDSVLELLEQFIFQKAGVDGLEVLFPRFHQWDCIQKVRTDVLANGPGQRYLQQHSAGSGKSNTIAWLAFQLAFLMTNGHQKVFDKVLVVTDRVVLDRQLGDVLAFMQGDSIGQMVNCRRTRELLEALQSKTPIVATTIHKFAWLQKVLDQDPGVSVDPGVWNRIRSLKFAVIIDEAHSSQGGELFQQMLHYLTAHRKSGRSTPNVSFFAFTATPRQETLEIFGTKNRMGELEPFHSYSMSQAIAERYILDVRKGYYPVETLYHVETVAAGATVKCTRDVFRHIFEDETVVRAKAREVVTRFKVGIAHLLDGEAQAMVVCSSRKAAAMFKLALDDILREEQLAYKTLGAFTGEVLIDGKTYDEFNINGVAQDTDLGRLFVKNPNTYRFLVVADKFQVGFDCPRLSALFVDKTLEDIAAVQTLSRLNRSFPGKDSTLVVDFVNDGDDIMAAFSRFIEPLSTMSSDIIPRLGELAQLLSDFGAFSPADVEEHWRVFRLDAEKLYALVEPVKVLCTRQGPEWQARLVALLRELRELYIFGVKIRPEAAVHQKLYVLALTLLRRLDKAEIQSSARLPLKVVMATIVPFTPVEGGEQTEAPIQVPVAGEKRDPPTHALDLLLQDLSRRSLSDLADSLHEVVERLGVDDEVRNQALVNTFDTFAREGVAADKLSRLVIEKLLTGSVDGSALYDATQGDGVVAVETRLNVLRVVYLRHQRNGGANG